MPRRLGDDPLARAKAAQPDTLVAPVGEGGASASEVQRSSRASYNDVFFQRRAEEERPPRAAEGTAPREVPEISEISEIPEIREAAAAAPVEPILALPPALPEEASTSDPVAEAPPPILASTSVEAVASLSGDAAGPASEVEAAAVVPPGAEPTGPAGGPGAPGSGDAPDPGDGGGCFQRRLGKFK